jgi:rod shape-determining protein MreC
LGLILLSWLFLPPIFKSLLKLSFFQMQAPALLVSSHVRDIQDFWALRFQSKPALIEGIRDLARLNAAYELRLHESEQLRLDLIRLEQILGLPSLPGYRYEVARVARRDMNGWWQQIVIRKGRNDGIRAGDAVLFTGGVVGRVREVGPHLAVVDLLSSQHIRLAAVVEGDDRPVSYQGGINPPLHPPRGRIQFVPSDISSSAVDTKRILTSGLGGVFPPGLVIGEIGALTVGADELFQAGPVTLDSRLNSLREVAVLIPLNEERER